MGAELIGYFTIVPNNWKEVAQKKIDELNEIMGKADPSKIETTIARFVKAETSWPQLDIEDYFSDGETPEEILASIKDCIPTMDQICEALDSFASARDSADMPIEIKGVRFDIVFCGERSWGDEPDGYGYQNAKMLDESGISDAWNTEVTRSK